MVRSEGGRATTSERWLVVRRSDGMRRFLDSMTVDIETGSRGFMTVNVSRVVSLDDIIL
jgi:hypothetical protein